MNTCFGLLELMVFRGAIDPTGPLFAYLDPGAGSMLLQVIIAGICSVAVMLKIYWQAFVSFFRWGSKSQASDETESESSFDVTEENDVDKKAA